MKRHVVLVAGGQGTRMQGVLPKQFLLLANRPVLMHTLERFAGQCDSITLVMHADYIAHWETLCKEYNFTVPHTVVAGGVTRADSVLNGLKHLAPESLVAVHDAVRPFVFPTLIDQLFVAAAEHGSAIPVVPIKDTLRLLDDSGSTTVDRSRYRAVQTPQVFVTGLLQAAFKHPAYSEFTDEASLYEAVGHEAFLVAGDDRNIKLTVPADLIVAETFCGMFNV